MDVTLSIFLKTSKAWVRNCEIRAPGSDGYGIIVHNSNLKVSKCNLYCKPVLYMESTIKNFVEFKQNKMMHGLRADFLKDKKSTLKEDFKRGEKKVVETDLSKLNFQPLVTVKDRSKFTSEVKQQFTDDIPVFKLGINNPRFPSHYKVCERCSIVESVSEKFKFCEKCNEACYCSLKCQKIDWKEHQIMCRKYRSKE